GVERAIGKEHLVGRGQRADRGVPGSGCGGRVHDLCDPRVDRRGDSAVPEERTSGAAEAEKPLPLRRLRDAPLRGVAVIEESAPSFPAGGGAFSSELEGGEKDD